jgi:hypothetical protein
MKPGEIPQEDSMKISGGQSLLDMPEKGEALHERELEFTG